MEITLSPRLEALVAADIASGRYATVEEYIADAVEMLHERQTLRDETLEEQREKLEVALAGGRSRGTVDDG